MMLESQKRVRGLIDLMLYFNKKNQPQKKKFQPANSLPKKDSTGFVKKKTLHKE